MGDGEEAELEKEELAEQIKSLEEEVQEFEKVTMFFSLKKTFLI